MSWNTLLIVVRDRSIADLAGQGWQPTGTATTGDEAATTPLEGIAAVEMPAGVLLIDASMAAVDVAPDLARALGTEVVTALFAGVSDGYWWRVDGPEGLRREWGRSVEDITVDHGDALPEEGGVEWLDEDSLFGLLEARTGLGQEWLESPAQPLLPPGGAASEPPVAPRPAEGAPPPAQSTQPPPQRRGFWARLTGRGR